MGEYMTFEERFDEKLGEYVLNSTDKKELKSFIRNEINTILSEILEAGPKEKKKSLRLGLTQRGQGFLQGFNEANKEWRKSIEEKRV